MLSSFHRYNFRELRMHADDYGARCGCVDPNGNGTVPRDRPTGSKALGQSLPPGGDQADPAAGKGALGWFSL